MPRCTLLGHRHRFHAHGATLRWQCERGCGDCGSKDYPTDREAAMFAAPSTAATNWASGLR